MNRMNPQVDWYFSKATKWQEELETLRTLILECGLTEELKWGVPCYTQQSRNVALIHEFKEYAAILFVKGTLLQDARGLLIQQTKDTQAARQIRFTNVREIAELEPVLKAYIHEAIEVEKSGLKVAFKKIEELVLVEEFQHQLAEAPALQAAFEALTPGRQRAYNLYFAAPKQAKTREARIAKCRLLILSGKGLND